MDYEIVAVGKETVPYRKDFSAEEIEKMNHEHTTLMLEADKKTTELKALSDQIKGEIKMRREKALVTRNLIAAKSIMVDTVCYLVPNHEKGMMDYIDPETDAVIFSRRLTPDEKQLRENRLRKVNE